MFRMPEGKKLFVIDGHTHLWDARPENLRNRYGLTFIEMFWNWPYRPDPARAAVAVGPLPAITASRARHSDLFVDGYCDMAIMMPTYLYEFYDHGFNTTEQCAALKDAYPDNDHPRRAHRPARRRAGPRPARGGPCALEVQQRQDLHRRMEGRVEGLFAQGGACRAATSRNAGQLGIDIIHIHKGPTIHPLNSRRLRRARHRRGGDGVPRHEIRHRPLRHSAHRRLLLDRATRSRTSMAACRWCRPSSGSGRNTSPR